MGDRSVDTAGYRGFRIAINPSGKPEDARTDAFTILEPSANPMFTVTLHEHPRGEIKTYATKEEANDAAMRLAHAWIDARHARPAE